MNYPIALPSQIRAVLPALRRHRGLTQAELGELVGVSQKRIARIESAPEKVSFEQVTKLLMILGTNLVIVDKAQPLATNVRTSRPAKREENW